MTLFPTFRKKSAHQDSGVYHFKGWMRGGSGSFLVEDSLGREWVVKMFENFQGDRLLPNEVLGSIFLRAVGLPSLPWRKIQLDPRLIEVLRGEDKRLASHSFATEQFASLFIGGSRYVTRPIACIPEDETWVRDLLGLYVFDIWAGHTDSREVLSALDIETSQVSLIAIDNGHLFLGPKSQPTAKYPARQYLSPVMRTLVTKQSSLAILEWWIEHLRFVLPAFIDLQSQGSDRPWGTSALHVTPEVFQVRLADLERLVKDDRQLQIEPPRRMLQPKQLIG